MSEPTPPPAIPDLDQAPYSEALRRALYDAVVRIQFPAEPEPEETVPTYSPDDGQLTVFYAWGRWFAVWRDLDCEDEGHLPFYRRWGLLRLQSDPSRPEGIMLREV